MREKALFSPNMKLMKGRRIFVLGLTNSPKLTKRDEQYHHIIDFIILIIFYFIFYIEYLKRR